MTNAKINFIKINSIKINVNSWIYIATWSEKRMLMQWKST